MPRYDDRYASTRLYVGHLGSRTRSRDLEHLFNKYGRVRDVDMKRDYAFVEFSDPRDADDARYHLDGRDFDGSRIIVEFAKGVPRGSREYLGRGPPPGSGRCFNCGIDGHWARDCKAGDWKNKCYRCGDRGHIERNCKNSPKKLKRGRSYSGSPGRSRSPVRGRSRSPSYTRGRSYSRSRSPAPRRERSVDVNRSRSLSLEPKDVLPSKGRRRSLTPEDGSPRASTRVRKLDDRRDRDYSPIPRGRSPSPRGRSPSPRGRSPSPRGRSPSPRGRSPSHRGRSPSPRGRSPSPSGRSPSPVGMYESPPQANGRSPSPRERSPLDDDFEDRRRSPRRGSVSPA